jgi:L-lysine exporter family protein LysE/ArgO
MASWILSDLAFSDTMFSDTIFALVRGFILYASLLIVIGPKALFILRQGLRRQYLLPTAILGALPNILLVGIGVGGLGAALAADSTLFIVATSAGALFLGAYGLRSFCAVWRRRQSTTHADGTNDDASNCMSLPKFAAIILGFSLLNPATYVDTLILIGTASGVYPPELRLPFGIGAALAATLWIFALTYGASRLAPMFRHPLSWRFLDGISGCIMVGMAYFLFTTLPNSF